MILAAVGIVAALVLGVVWACLRVAGELSRYEDWDDPLIEQKREHWK